MSFFASKTISMIRAPDQFVYPAPFTLIEIFFVAPLEPFVSKATYRKLNIAILTVIFSPITILVHSYERIKGARNVIRLSNESTIEAALAQDETHISGPDFDDDDESPSEEVKKILAKLPDASHVSKLSSVSIRESDEEQSSETVILRELQELRKANVH